jgi:hypothetical protein
MYAQPRNPEITLVTNLSREECIQALVSKIVEPHEFGYLNPSYIIGRINGNQLQLEKNFDYRNSWHVRFCGTLYAATYGTIIEGSLVIHAFTEPGVRTLFTLLLLFVLAATVIQIGNFAQGSWQFDWSLVEIYFGLLISFLFLNALRMNGSASQRRDEQDLVEFLKETLKAAVRTAKQSNES